MGCTVYKVRISSITDVKKSFSSAASNNTSTKTVHGQKFYYRTFNVNSEDYTFNVVLSQGDNQHQSVDVNGISKDIYLEITSTTNKYTVADITDQYSYLLGDVNDDGEVNISDVINLINIILSSETISGEYLARCDINSDNEVNISDVIVLINIILNNK